MDFDPVAFARTGNGNIGEQRQPESSTDDFDPVAFALGGRDVLAPKARAAYGADDPATPIVRDVRAPNRGDAFVGELVQGASLGFADELQGLANGTGARDEMRRQSEANREAHPGYALAGGVAGGALTAPLTGGLAGAGPIGKALSSPVARAAIEGAVAGAGYSDADTVGGRLVGAGLGAAGGAAVAKAIPLIGQGIKRVIAGAPERVEKKMIQDLVGSTNPSARNKLLGPGGAKAKDVAEVIRAEPEIKRALGDPQATYAAVKSASDRLDDEMSNVYRLVDQADPGLSAAKVRETASKYTNELRKKFMPEIADRLDSAIEARLATRAAPAPEALNPSTVRASIAESLEGVKGKGAQNKAIRYQLGQLDDVIKSYGNDAIPAENLARHAADITRTATKKLPAGIGEKISANLDDIVKKLSGGELAGETRIPASGLRSLVSSVQRQAYEGGTVNPSVAKETSREFSMSLRNMLNEHVEGVATRNKLDIAPIRALNKKRSILANLEDVTERNAIRDVGATKVAPFSLDNAERIMKSPGAALASVLSGNAVPYYGVKAAVAGVREADRGLARLVEWVGKNGGASKIPRSELLERAAKFGVSKAAAARLAEIKPAAAAR